MLIVYLMCADSTEEHLHIDRLLLFRLVHNECWPEPIYITRQEWENQGGE